MRPEVLRVAGFTAFREPVTVDFSDTDLFVLSGPTGSGKSSVIDAICFALYGSIPRLSGVAPLVSVGMNEARVQLTFEVGGESWTVARLVARQGSGATQKDVRLEGPDGTHSGVKEVNARIEQLVGLGFEHFTRCVVLPQGKFAAFLEDAPRQRQDLLRQLLDLGVFEGMRSLAAAKARHIEIEETAITTQLHDLTVDESQIAGARSRLEDLDAFVRRAEHTRAELTAAVAELEEAQRATAETDRILGLLQSIRAPDSLDDVAGAVEAAAAAMTRAETELAAMVERLRVLRVEQDELGEVAGIEARLERHRRVTDLVERVERGRGLVGDAERERDARASHHKDMQVLHESAVASLRELERRHAAHAIRSDLADGDDCPVCLRTIERVPQVSAPGALDEARTSEREAAQEVRRASEALGEAERDLAGLARALDDRRAELDEARATTEGLPGVEELMDQKERAEAVAAAIREIDAEVTRLRALRDEARKTHTEAREQAAEVAASLDRARDPVAALEPPAPGREDVAADWRTFVDWSVAETGRWSGTRVEQEAATTVASERVAKLRADLAAAGRELGLDEDVDPRDAALAERASLGTRLERMEEDLARAERLREKLAELTPARQRYAETERLLKSNRFPQWVISEAMEDLVAYANETLATLAGGSYSLRYTESEFMVVDHRNADARRSVRTLSGGETFLVSLALALALAERVAAGAGTSTSSIGSMFLDEGFGTLDTETLDTVASVVTELGSRDRMVGLITHVRELADQIPTRFEVRKRPGGATVQRVDT